jgi:hypothetical protein
VLYVSLYCFALAHLLEASSYLVVNIHFMGSDMALLVDHAPWTVLAIASLILLPALAALVYEAPHVGDALAAHRDPREGSRSCGAPSRWTASPRRSSAG